MNKKESAISFLKLASRGQIDEAYEKFISQNFIHHNQYFKGDRQSRNYGISANRSPKTP